MLKKLLKYDWMDVNKVLVVFYGLALFFAILTRVFLSIENSFIMNIIGQICSGVAISMMFNIVINNLMRCWVRFRQNLYGDESYLTHTLPVKKTTLYHAKMIAAFITMFASVAVIALTLFVAYYSKELWETVKNFLLPLAGAYESTVVTILLAVLFVLFLELMNALQCGFMGIIVGHKMNHAKIGYSVLFGFAAYMMSQVLAVIMVFTVALFNEDLMNLFVTNEMVSVDTIKTVIYMAIGVYFLIFVIGYFVNVKLFNQGVNVD